jgi:uncharacterized repeat protein (TIGR01451 family)
LNEGDLAPTGQGAADGRANMTVDFGFILGASPQAGVVGVADPFINKLGDPALVFPGEHVTFTLTVGNRGNAAATNVVVVDPVPTGFVVQSATASQGTYTIDGNTVTFSIGTVQPGQIVTLSVAAP